MGRGVTKWDLVPPTIFIIVVNAVVWDILMEVCGPQESQHGLVWVTGKYGTVFYADNGGIMGRNPIWVQGTLTALVRMFGRDVLYTNLEKTKSRTCNPGFICGKLI